MTMPGFSGEPPKDVLTVDNLGNATQNLNPNKVTNTATGRMSQGFLGTEGLSGAVVTTATNLFGQFAGKIADDNDPTTVNNPQDVSDQVGGFFSNPVTGLLDSLLGFLSPILQGVTEGLSGIAEAVAGLFGLRWAQVDNHENNLIDLEDRTQSLEGVITYGALYCPNDISPTTTLTRAPFYGVIHNGYGVTYTNNGIRINSKGLFRVDAQMYYSWVQFSGDGCYMDIVVHAPNGSEYSRKSAIARTQGTVTVTNSHTFVVPSSGYHVSVEVSTDASPIGATRVILGGRGFTSLTVNKWSTETS